MTTDVYKAAGPVNGDLIGKIGLFHNVDGEVTDDGGLIALEGASNAGPSSEAGAMIATSPS